MRRAIGLILLLLSFCLSFLPVSYAVYEPSTNERLLHDGYALRTALTLAWEGLPSLDEETNLAIRQLLEATRFEAVRAGTGESGYFRFDLFLQDASVVDISVLVEDGIYYEQSNLLGGQTVAFSKPEFSSFMRRIAEQAGSAVPSSFDLFFDLPFLALSGADSDLPALSTLNDALRRIQVWEADASRSEEIARPQVYIPGLYGAKARVMRITREDILSLASILHEALQPGGLSLDSGEPIAAPAEGISDIQGLLHDAGQILSDLPAYLSSALPEEMEAIELLWVYGLDGALITRQVKASISEQCQFVIEWIPTDYYIPTLYVSARLAGGAYSMLLSQEEGKPIESGAAVQRVNNTIAEITIKDETRDLGLMITRTESISSQERKEVTQRKTDCRVINNALADDQPPLALSLVESITTAGIGEQYARESQLDAFLYSGSPDARKVFTLSSTTEAEAASTPFDRGAEAVRPAALTDDAFALWYSDVQSSFIQVVYTFLGRLPPGVAAYILERSE